MLHLYQSNRLEDLAELLWKIQESSPLSDPLQEEEILVQSQGMRRFIEHSLAKSGGIAAMNLALGAESFALAKSLIGGCRVHEMACNLYTRPLIYVLSGLLMAVSAVALCCRLTGEAKHGRA